MICYPNAKINLGLNIVSKRTDGFHNINSFFLPIPLYDVLEVQVCSSGSKSTNINYSGIYFPKTNNDLVIKAYDLLNNDFQLPGVNIHLHKNIPFGSGLGGGSSDATFMLMTLNKLFNLKLTMDNLLKYAKNIGSDCSFFLFNDFSYVSGYGQLIKPVEYSFQEDHIVVVKPSFHCSTSMIFSNYKLKKNDTCSLSLDSNSNVWKKNLVNNLESVTFSIYPELNNIKESLYSLGATYASMSGSGSSVYGLFKEKPKGLGELDHWVWEGVLSKFLK